MTDKPLTLADYAERIIEPRLKALELILARIDERCAGG